MGINERAMTANLSIGPVIPVVKRAPYRAKPGRFASRYRSEPGCRSATTTNSPRSRASTHKLVSLEQAASGPAFETYLARERDRSRDFGGRTVFDRT
jgi:hypothetical protein